MKWFVKLDDSFGIALVKNIVGGEPSSGFLAHTVRWKDGQEAGIAG